MPNRQTKYPHKFELALSDAESVPLERIRAHLSTGRVRRVSQNAVIRQMIAHCLHCPAYHDLIGMSAAEIFLTDV